MESHIILSGSYKNAIHTLKFTPGLPSNSLQLLSSIPVGHRPSWITSHPSSRSVVFTGLEQEDGKVLALEYDGEGEGRVVVEVSSGGDDPCSLLATTNELFIANYASGSIAIYPLSSSPPHLTTLTPPKVVEFKGKGPNIARQDSSHAHQVIMHPEREELLVLDLGADKVWRLSKSKEDGGEGGGWEISGNVYYSPGGGPRHAALYDGMLYTLLELTNEVTAHIFPALPSEPILTHTISTLSNPPPSKDMLAAEILIPPPNPSFPHPYLYVSNRCNPGTEGDTIAIYSLVDKEKPLLVNEVHTGLIHVRGMEFGGEGGKWLAVGGLHGGGVKVFERIEGGRDLKVVAENETVEAPAGFLWM